MAITERMVTCFADFVTSALLIKKTLLIVRPYYIWLPSSNIGSPDKVYNIYEQRACCIA